MTSENPFRKPIQGQWRHLQSLRWRMPYLPQAVIAFALLFSIALLCALYATVGIAAQISAMCLTLMSDAQAHLTDAAPVERSAYIVATLVYCAVFLPFWLVQTPVLLLGWAVQRLAESPRRPDIRRPAFTRQGFLNPRLSDLRR